MRAKLLLAACLAFLLPASAGADFSGVGSIFPGGFFGQSLNFEPGPDDLLSGPFFSHPTRLLQRRERRLVYQGNLEDLYHRKAAGKLEREISGQVNRAEFFWPAEEKFWNVGGAVGFAERGFKFKLPSEPSYAVDWEGRQEAAHLILAKSIFPGRLQAGLGLQTASIAGWQLWDFSGELLFSPFEELEFGLARRRLNANQRLKLWYEDAFLDLPLDAICSQTDWQFNFKPSSRLRFSFNFEDSKLGENRGLAHQTDFFLEPAGSLSGFSSQLEVKLSPRWGVHIGQRKNYFLDFSGDLFYRDQKFGKVTNLKLVDEGVLFGASLDAGGGHRFGSEVEAVKISGETRGHAETWPFTPTLLDLLGNRLYFRVKGKVRIFRLGAQYEKEALFAFGLKGKIDYLTLRPSGQAATWNPAVLVFGVANFKQSELALRRLDLLFLRLGLVREVGNLSLGYNVSQFLPLHKKVAPNASEYPPSTAAAAPGLSRSTGGGTLHHVSVSYRIP